MMNALGIETWEAEVAGQQTAPSGGIDWRTLLAQQAASWSRTAQGILQQRNMPRGVLTQSGPDVFTYVQPEGSQVTLPVGTARFSASASPGIGIILIGGAAVLLVFMLARRKG